MLWVPAPAVAGSNVPAFTSVIPVPLQVPPAVTALKVTDPSFVQKGPAAVIVASGGGATVMSIVLVSSHDPLTTKYVIVWVPAPAVAGSKIPTAPFIIPVPLQVPPAVAAERVTDPSVTQKGPAGVMVASGAGSTTIST